LTNRQVVLLEEGSTAYGQSDSVQGPFVFSFPLNIASLRTAYLRGAASAPRTIGSVFPRVPLALDDSLSPREIPQVMSRLTQPTLDIALDRITDWMREHDIRLIGVRATDIRDKLFLISELHRR